MRQALVTLALALVATSDVLAQGIAGTPTGLPAPERTITFEGAVPGTPAAGQYSALGVTFGPGLIVNASSYFMGSGGATQSIDNFSSGPTFNPFDIYFSSAIQAATFQFVTNPGVSIFTAMLGGVDVYTFSAATTYGGPADPVARHYGFVGVTFDQIHVDAGGVNRAMALDNLEFNVTTTPEPGSALLLVTGLVGIVAVVRRRKRVHGA